MIMPVMWALLVMAFVAKPMVIQVDATRKIIGILRSKDRKFMEHELDFQMMRAVNAVPEAGKAIFQLIRG